jgi:haloalkane dehalogenase
VLINTFGFVPDGRGVDPPLLVRLARMPVAGEQLVQGLGLNTRVALGGAPGDDPERRTIRRAYRSVQGSWEERAGTLAFPRLLPLGPDDPGAALFGRIDRFTRSFEGPVLLAWGMRDPILGQAWLHEWRDRLPHAQVLELANSGHAPPEEAPDQIVATLRLFLSKSTAARPRSATRDLAGGAHPARRRGEG